MPATSQTTAAIIRMRMLIIFLLITGCVGVWVMPEGAIVTTAKPLQVSFLDVGQGDAIFIETPEGIQILIDGGRDATVLRALGEVMDWSDRSIDLVIATHPDEDHIGGLIDVLTRYEVTSIIATENTGESLAAAAYRDAMQAEGADVVMARAGQEFVLGASTTLTILSPARDPSMLESNTSSIVAKLQHGEIGFMLTGDAPAGIEQYLVSQYGISLESEVVKLGHHGSDTSSSQEFLAATVPIYAVVSAGKDNRYGHPHRAVLDRVALTGAQVVSTAESGTITFLSDGVQVFLE